jgi:hypothetical protein
VNPFVNEMPTVGVFFALSIVSIIQLSQCAAVPQLPQMKANSSALPDIRIFQIMVESFIHRGEKTGYGCGYGSSHHLGDLAGIRAAIPYIKSTGADTLWLTPVFDSDARTPDAKGKVDCRLDATGYYARNYFDVDPRFGTMQEFKELVDEVHKSNLRLILDLVPGHNKGNVSDSPKGRALANNVDFTQPSTMEYIMEVTEFWIENTKIDGFRIDQMYQVPSRYYPALVRHMDSVCQKVHGRDCIIVGEFLCFGKIVEVDGLGQCQDVGHDNIDNIRQSMLQFLQTPSNPNQGLPNLFNFPMMLKLRSMLFQLDKDVPASDLAKLFDWQFTSTPRNSLTMMFNNHDFPRVGNEMWSSLSVCNFEKTKEYYQRHLLAFAFLAAYPGPIQWFYNDEIGSATEGLRLSDSRFNCLERGLCLDHVGRINGKIDQLSADEEELKKAVAELMGYRDNHPSLGLEGSYRTVIADDSVYGSYHTHPNGDRALFLMNIAGHSLERSVSVPEAEETFTVKLEPLGYIFHFW